MITVLNNGQTADFLRSISYSPTVGFKTVGQVDAYGMVVAAAGYDHWTPNSVQMHIWIPRPDKVSKSFYTEGFKYPFVMCGRGLVIGITPSNNAPALHFNKKIGFTEVYRMKDGWEVGVDFVVQEMRKENCRWLRRKHELAFQETKESNQHGRSSRQVPA